MQVVYSDCFLRGARGEFALANEGGLRLWRKELAYPDTFVKVNDKGHTEFELPVDESRIDDWIRTFEEMKADGIEVPVPIGHTTDPSMRRGTVERLTKEPSQHPQRRGRPALFCYVKFSSPEYEEQFKHSDVSLFMPGKFTSGKGKTYHRPIRHVALTDYPVIPGLSKFEHVEASYSLSLASEYSQAGESPMPLATLAQKMGVQVPDGADDAAIEQAILEAWEAGGEGGEGGAEPPMEDEGEEMGEPGELPPEILDEGEGSGEGPTEDDSDEFPEEEEEDEEMPRGRGGRNFEPPPSLGFSHGLPRSVVKKFASSRATEIDQLVKDKKITKPVADRLKKKYASAEQVDVALSHEMADDSKPGDDFDDVMAALSLNAPVARSGEQTGHQVHAGDDPSQSPMVKDAERRRAKAQGRR